MKSMMQTMRTKTAGLAIGVALLLGFGSLAVHADNPFRLLRYLETKTAPTISSGAVTFNLANGTHFQTTLNANVTSITFSNPPTTGYASAFTVVLTQDGTGSRTVAGWPGAVKWAGGSAPTQTATAAKSDIYSFVTYDGGTTWWGLVIGQNF